MSPISRFVVGQAEAAVLGLEEDVGEHGQRASGGDRSAHDGQAASQVLLHDRELHVRSTPGRGRSRMSDAGLRRAGFPAPAKPRHSSVCIFLHSSRSVIIIIMVWTRWTAVLRPVRRRRCAGRSRRWTHGLARGAEPGRPTAPGCGRPAGSRPDGSPTSTPGGPVVHQAGRRSGPSAGVFSTPTGDSSTARDVAAGNGLGARAPGDGPGARQSA